MAGDFEPDGVLDSLNRAGQGTWHLVCRLGGGRKTGAWVVEDRYGVRAVLKWHPMTSTRRDLDGTAALVARARARGWPTPAWLAWGLDGRQRPYVLAELVAGEHLDAMDDAALDALLAVLDRQRGLAGPPGIAGTGRARDAWCAVFGDGSAWRCCGDAGGRVRAGCRGSARGRRGGGRLPCCAPAGRGHGAVPGCGWCRRAR